MTIKLKIEGDRIKTESGVEVGFYDSGHAVDEPIELPFRLPFIGSTRTLPEAEAAYNAHLDAIGVVSIATLNEILSRQGKPVVEAAYKHGLVPRAELDEAEHRAHCDWREDDAGVWQTGCGGAWEFMDGTPKQNSAYFCFRCGGQIVQYQHKEGRDEQA